MKITITYLQVGVALMIIGAILFLLVAIWPTPMPWINWLGYTAGMLLFGVGGWHAFDELLASADFHNW